MFFSNLISSIKSKLAVKSIIVVIIFISIVTIFFTVFFMTYQKRILAGELYKRAHALARNLAYNSRNFIITTDKPVLQSLVSGVQEEPDIKNVFLTDHDGTVLTSTDTTHTYETLTFPARLDSTGRINWLPIDNSMTMRMILPVEIKAPIIESDTLLYPPKETIPISDENLPLSFRSCFQPGFTFTGEEVTFTALFNNNIPTFLSIHTVSASIENRTLRFLVQGSNGFWSHNGRYIVFYERNPSQLVVFDTVTREKEIIARNGIESYGVPCFTPDDRYVIVTLLTEIGNERLFRIPRDGGKYEQLTFHDGQHWFPNCSPDGKWILYSDLKNYTLYVYNNETKKTSRVFPDLKDRHFSGSFSPDGTKFCYIRCLNVSPLSWDVFVADFPANGKPETNATTYGTQLTFTGGYKWFTDWSPDGKWITYAQRHGYEAIEHQIWIVQSQGGYPINLNTSLWTQRKIIGYAVLDISMENLNHAIAAGNRIAIIIAFSFTGTAILCAFLLMGNIVRPVKNIARSAEKIARGDFDQKISTRRKDEIGILENSFNKMTTQLKTLIEEKDIRNRELEEAYKKLQTLDKSKDDFLSLVSHELRTPLSSILVYTDMLLDGKSRSEEKRTKYLGTILSESKRLTRLINEVLDLSKIEAGRMSFTIEVLHVRSLIGDYLDAFLPVFEKNNINFEYEQVSKDTFVLGDRDKVAQVLTNIISNAVKYTPAGGTISISANTNKDTVKIAVKDTGKGIAYDDIPKVFDRFSQLETIDHHAEGSGLGMTISKLIIEKIGGKIWIESEINSGTTVTFTLPRAEGDYKPDAISDRATTSNLFANKEPLEKHKTNKILIVDDEQPIREAIQECIEEAGYSTIVAAGGYEALQLALRYLPDLLILDVMMPDLSGLEVCKMLRKDPKTREIKIVMLSARGQKKEKQEGLAAGADYYMTKPFDYKELIATINELLK